VATRRVAGIDVGGTFTDLLIYETGPELEAVRLAKIPTTASNQADGVLAALAAAGLGAGALDLIIHGTTTTTNAVLERKLAKVGLITTRGFRDSLELGRRTRPRAYGMTGSFEPLIPRQLRLEIDERISAAGEVLIALDVAAVAAAVHALLRQGCESLLIHFLREQSFKAQVNRWSDERLADALDMLLEAEALSRTTAVPAEAVCGRTLMNIAALAKAR